MMNKAMFPAFKFLSLDYAYENVMRQKLATSWMLIQFPKGILQDEDYCHNKIFVNDIYRRPWKRSIPTCKLHEENSITDDWKKYASNAEFLEKKEELIDIVPSSNPCSQIDLEEVSLLTESYATKHFHSHEDCWKSTLPTNIDDYILPEETVFLDYLAQFRLHLPGLATLLSRLKTFSVQDPLVGFNRVLSAKDTLYRLDTSTNEHLEPNILLEEFHLLSPSAEESLILPCTLELDEHAKEGRSFMSDLIARLQLAPEKVSEMEGLTSTAGLTKIQPKNDFIEQSTIKRSPDPCKYEEALDTVCFRSYHEAELEVSLTPPCLVSKDTANKICVNLAEEELSPTSPIFYITDVAEDIIECLEYNADIKHLLLKVPHIQNKSERFTIDEIKQNMSINPDISIDVTLEDNWWHTLGQNEENNKSIEPLTANIPSTHSLTPTKMESFNTITASQLESILEESVCQCSLKQNIIVHNHEEQARSRDSSPSKIIHIQPPSQRNVSVTFADPISTADTTHSLIHENEEDESSVLLPLQKHEPKQNLQSITTAASSISHVKPANINLRDTCKAHKSMDGGLCGPEKLAKNDADLLSSFIVLRTKSLLGQAENRQTEKLQVHANGTQNCRPEHKENNVVSCNAEYDGSPQKRSEENSKHHQITVHFTPTDSQCQAYRVLQAEAAPVLNKLKGFGLSACTVWNFASVTFDCTRFFLRQQEKTISDSCKIGNKSDKDMMMFKNASLLHILVTLRDLILTCSLDTALEYLYKAKHMYKSALGVCLEHVWGKLRIVQFVRDKTEEVNPKMTALLDWIEKEDIEHKQLKVLILTRMDSGVIAETLNNALSKTKVLKAIGLCPASETTFVDPKSVLNSLISYAFIITNNQYIGNDFPWAHFMLVIEYDCTDCWLKLSHDRNVSHMTLKPFLPDALILESTKHSGKDLLCDMQVPYVFLSSEELINSSEILQVLESRYNMTFIERSCSASLQLFGKSSPCAMITIDVSTVIILQRLDEFMHDKSAENLILKLVALSLQYSYCWVLLYAKQRSHSEYNLSGDILHNITLIYAAVVQLTSKSEDLEIKVLISPGVDETGSCIHQIVDHMLMSCTSDPYKWLDRSWLSVLITKAENILLSFPCINPMVAQLMLCRGVSLQWLLSATNDQLKKLLPEVPSKFLKLSRSTSSPRPADSHTPANMEHCGSTDNVQGSVVSVHNPCISITENKKNIFELQLSSAFGAESYIRATPPAPELSNSFGDICSTGSTFLGFSSNQKKAAWPENVFEQHIHQSTDQKRSLVSSPFPSGKDGFLQRVFHHPHHVDSSMENKPSFSINSKHFFADLPMQQNQPYCITKLENVMYTSQPLPTEKQSDPLQGERTFHNHLLSGSNNESDYFNFSQMRFVGKRRFMISSLTVKEGTLSGKTCSQPDQGKRRKLTYERVPGRCDGQTRLKFF
ncbi:protein shortage in chiasmata 1 ortholog isoform X2 [Pseudophryne corroboree]|uniref:protein shortage in chiasmata 1 ortholog isoform X2 n=1 Tax=Pseudophryne corroboree TaxID=495146 RepID=UPI0030818A8D